MKEYEKKARQIIKERTDRAAALADQVTKAEAKMNAAKAELDKINASLSFEDYTKAKRNYEDAEGYANMLKAAQRKEAEMKAEDLEQYKQIREEIRKYYREELEAAEAEVMKPAKELLEMIEKKANKQDEYNTLLADLGHAMSIKSGNICGCSNNDAIWNKYGIGTLLMGCRALIEAKEGK